MENQIKVVKCLNHLKDPYTKIPKISIEPGEFHLLFANLTYCGPKAESFILSDSVFDSYQGLLFVETHCNDVKLQLFQDKLAKAQWNSNGSFTPAAQGDTDTGTSGGELVATKNNIDSYPVRSEVIEQIQNEVGEPIRFACRILKIERVYLCACF